MNTYKLERTEELERWIDENIEWISLMYDLHKQRNQNEKESNETRSPRETQPPNCS